MIAALYVAKNGCYSGMENVETWDIDRDARQYAGPWPVVAHPPCERWGRFWHGSTRKPYQYELGADDGCFDAALWAVKKFGGVLEHPKDSLAWRQYEINRPPAKGGWAPAGDPGGWTCCVEQGFYGHFSRKPTWLYANAGYARLSPQWPELRWGRGEQRLHPVALAKHGYAKARRIGMVAMIGGKNKKIIRDATPPEFRDVLIAIAESINQNRTAS